MKLKFAQLDKMIYEKNRVPVIRNRLNRYPICLDDGIKEIGSTKRFSGKWQLWK